MSTGERMAKARRAGVSPEMSRLLEAAMQAKSRELGKEYSQRQLAEDSAVDWSYVARVLRGERRPSRDVLRAWARALDPYFPLDEELLLAGHAPDDPAKLDIFLRITRLPAQSVSEIGRRVGEFFSESEAAQNTNGEDQGESGDDTPTTSP